VLEISVGERFAPTLDRLIGGNGPKLDINPQRARFTARFAVDFARPARPDGRADFFAAADPERRVLVLAERRDPFEAVDEPGRVMK